jgi:GNAT superfamily N-acetyltransferase
MGLWTWWAEDALTPLSSLSDFAVAPARDVSRIALLTHLSDATVAQRFAAGHTCYVAFLAQTPVAYGWVARTHAELGELQLHLRLPAGECYLWDFATLPAWRGLGIYPRLLQAILRAERAARVWIAHAPENRASQRGIRHAGFQMVGQLSFAQDGRAALAQRGDPQRALAGAALLAVPLITVHDAVELNPCWGCFITRQQTSNQPPRLCGADCCSLRKGDGH